MATYATPLSAGKTSPQGFLRILGKVFTSSGVVESAALTVAAQTSPDMTIKVSGSSLNDNAVFVHTDGHFIHAWNTNSANVTITANASGSGKTDAIVAYVDLAGGDASNANNPSALKFVAVRGASGAPNSGEITASAVGSNPYLVLAHVAIANGAASINSGNITDQRTRAYLDSSRLAADSIGRAHLGSGALPIAYIPLYAYGGSPGTSYVTIDPSKTTIDFSKLVTNASAAYFRITGNNSGGGVTTNIILRNDTDGANITGSELTITATGATESVSGDILANLPTTSKRMAYQVKTTSGGLAFHRVVLEIHY
jgi:hypothetical protein